MKCFVVVLCAFCVVIFTSVDGKRGSFSSSRKSKPSNNNRYKPPHPPPPPPPPAPPKKTEVNTFLDSERHSSQNNRYSNTGFGNHQNPSPIGFDNVNRGTNAKPIGFEGINNRPESGKIGFDGVNSGNKPSAPVFSGNINSGQSNSHFGQPHAGQPNPSSNFGQSYPGQQNPSPNFGQSYPNQQNPSPNVGHTYPNQPNYGSSNVGGFQSGQPNIGHGYPTNQNLGNPYSNQQGFGQNYPSNPNNFGQNYHSGYGNSYQGQPNFGTNQGYPSFGNGYSNNHQQGFGGFGSSYGGNNFGMPGGGFGGGFFGSNNGFNNYGNGYNNYGKRSRFGLGGLPLPIPIPIPIPFGGFGGFGGGYNSHRSHRTLNDVVGQASNDSNNATSVYIINNSTVLPCTREHFRYDSYNISITTCTVLNCTAVSLKTVKDTNDKIETNYGSITMCLDPTATLTTNSSGSNLPKLSEVKTYWKSLCEHTNTNVVFNNSQIDLVNSTNGGNLTENINTFKTEQNSTMIKDVEEIKTITEAQTELTTVPDKQNITSENITNSNVTTASNTTGNPCVIFNCSTVEFCMPKVEIRCQEVNSNTCNYSVSSYTSCIELKMCNSQNSIIIDREVKLNTRRDIVEKDNVMTNLTFKENVTVIAYVPPVPLVNQNTTFVNGVNTTCIPQDSNSNMTGSFLAGSNSCVPSLILPQQGESPLNSSVPSSSPGGAEIFTSTGSPL